MRRIFKILRRFAPQNDIVWYIPQNDTVWYAPQNNIVWYAPQNDTPTGNTFMNHYYVYILTNWDNKVMYVGVTGNLIRRIYEHKNGILEGFTKKYHVHKLVYFEETSDVYAALTREKQLKGLLRSKKNALVETMNPDWHDLSEDWE